jgi:hypothetical protein
MYMTLSLLDTGYMISTSLNKLNDFHKAFESVIATRHVDTFKIANSINFLSISNDRCCLVQFIYYLNCICLRAPWLNFARSSVCLLSWSAYTRYEDQILPFRNISFLEDSCVSNPIDVEDEPRARMFVLFQTLMLIWRNVNVNKNWTRRSTRLCMNPRWSENYILEGIRLHIRF